MPTWNKNPNPGLEQTPETDIYRTLVEKNADGILVLDEGGTILYANPSAATIMGLKADDLRGRVIPLSHTAGGAISIEIPIAGDKPGHMDVLAVDVEWQGRPALLVSVHRGLSTESWRVAPRPVAQDHPRDVESHREAPIVLTSASSVESDRAGRDLVESDERDRLRLLAHALESTSELISVTDLQDRFTFVNKAFLEAYRYTKEEVLGNTPAILGSPNNPPSLPAEILECAHRDGWSGELLNRRKDGSEFPIYLSTSKVWNDAGENIGLVGVARDISEIKRLQQQLVQSQKMEAIGLLAGGVAHDFNNLLAVIVGCAEMLAGSADERVHDLATEIQKAGERAATLTAQLLAFSRKQILQPEVLEINAIITDSIKMLRRLISENIDLITIFDPSLGCVKADPSQIVQVILNLAVNARDAMPNGGKLTLQTSNAGIDERRAQPEVGLESGRYVVLTLTDTGIGMDAETQARIFEPFFTTKEKAQGTGLGLSTAYGIVKQSGCCITVSSQVAMGSRFKIYLPRVEEPAAEHPSKVSKTNLSPGSGERVLVVEDESTVRRHTCLVLRENGYEVFEAANGDEAIELAKQSRAPIHLLVADMVMPGMSGSELAAHLASYYPEMRVLFMSGYTEDAVVHRWNSKGRTALN